ncbi:response regulator transcription factor [Microbacterium paludicola]|uniref:Response regulator transcription factor n=1 Tax=Microbacterium paludicola TaxID=300019 RepID=A0A4Y9FT37_9MICO|nr:LuxR C-terminal-related transcriptional regulator [Microbacterium paludicola]MBF0816877.1 response regulator transcription factor [Microbacterium paludicola]TFU32398.1 response regulator transcription factor [Microbacterium paludicola]
MSATRRPGASDSGTEGDSKRARITREVFAALARGDWGGAADLVEMNWAALIVRDVSVIEVVADAMPESVRTARPAWAVARSYARHLRLDPAVRPLVFADSAPDPQPHHSPAERAVLWTSRAAGARTSGDILAAIRAVERAREAAELVAREDTAAAQVLPTVMFQWIQTYVLAGRFDQAMPLLSETFERAGEVGNARAQFDVAGVLGWVHSLSGLGRVADDWLGQQRRIGEEHPGLISPYVHGQLGQAVRAWDSVDLAAGLNRIEGISLSEAGEMLPFVAGSRTLIKARTEQTPPVALLGEFDTITAAYPAALLDSPFIAGHNRLVRSDILRLAGDSAAVVRMYADEEIAAGTFDATVLAHAYLLLDVPHRAREYAHRAMDEPNTWPCIQPIGHVLLAALDLRDGATSDAAAHVAQAADIGFEHDSFMSFAVLPHEDLRGIVPLAGDRLAARIAPIMDSGLRLPPPLQRRVTLTPQEQRVIHRLVRDLTEQELADALGISRSTARGHLQSLYRKFDVSDRTALRAAARREGYM